MRIAIISDIHSNIYALDAVLEDLKKKDIETIYCLGDLVGYNTRPNEVIERIRTLDIPCILGNHDEKMLLWDRNRKTVENLDEKEFVTWWTYEQINQVNFDFLKELPKTMIVEMFGKSMLLAHGSPTNISEYIRKDDKEKHVEVVLSIKEYDGLIFGHTHDCYSKTVEDKVFINAGSVGRMKDGDYRACYTIIRDNLAVEFVRVAYDYQRLADEILASPLPMIPI